MLKGRKDKRGLGFKNLLAFNKAMLGKQAWRLAENQSSLWSRVLKGLYFLNRSFFSVEKSYRPSWGWQSILYGRETISESVRWSIGNGEMVNIRENLWLKRGTIGGPATKFEPSKVADLIVNQDAKWNETRLRQLFDEDLVKEILSIPLNLPLEKDELIWTGKQSAKYSVKSGYNVTRDREPQYSVDQASTSFQLSRRLWKARYPPKLRFFLWNVCQNALPTKKILLRGTLSTSLYALYAI